jgi:hypothetical protein
MSLLNLSVNLVAYADELKNANPMVKFADLKWSMLGLPTDIPRQVPIFLPPGTTQTVMSTERTLTFTGATVFQISNVSGTTYVRLVGDFGARTARLDGDATTQWTLVKTNQLVRLTYTGTGTAPTFAGIQVGDGITLGSGFLSINQGDYVIVSKGASYVEFTAPNAVNETVIDQVEIYSSGPVQVGDLIDISSSQFAFPNRGVFTITRVTDQYVEFSNPEAVAQASVTSVSSGLSIYPEAYRWMLLAIDHKVVVKLNSDTQSGCEVEPPKESDLVNNPGLMIKRGKVFRIDIQNPTLEVAQGLLFLAE